MTAQEKSRIIYGDAPFIRDMGILTTLCLLHDEVLLFGTKSLDQQMEDHFQGADTSQDNDKALVEKMLEVLVPEGILSFYAPSDVTTAFPNSDELQLSGILGIEEVDIDGKKSMLLKIDDAKLNDFSRVLLRGFATGQRTVSTLLRDTSVISAAFTANIPIICEKAHIAVNPTPSKVSEVATFLSHRAFQKLALPELEAYHPEDILEARLKLNNELQEFRAGILELVWLLHQKVDIGTNLQSLGRHCDVLIDTKIASAIRQLENAIEAHNDKRIRRILKVSGGALLELGRAFVSPSLSTGLLWGSSAILKVAEGLETKQPSIQVASFVYKVKNRCY
jgi:hypothetical protein